VSLVFDLYAPGDSWLHRLDPRAKLWITLLAVVVVFLLAGPFPQLLFLLGVHALLLLAGVPFPSLVWLWRQMAVLLLFILLLQPFFDPGGRALLVAGPLRLTVGGLRSAAHLALRALNMAVVTGGLLFTTRQRDLVQAFVRLGLPYSWGLTLSLTLRFLPAIQSLFVTVREAQAARGWDPKGNLVTRARGYLPVLVAVIIGTLRQSDQLTLALAARGLASEGRRTVWHELRMGAADWAVLAASTVAFALFLAHRF
jgi:energy-coupling factor transport system permease protein